jgi:signal transduction histidine kinase
MPPGPTLLSLINEVLDLSKIEAGKLELSPEPVNLPRLLDEVIGTAGQLAEKNQNRLVVEAQENLGALNADSMRLKQILLNLLSNACKFTKEGEVALRVRKVRRNDLSIDFSAPLRFHTAKTQSRRQALRATVGNVRGRARLFGDAQCRSPIESLAPRPSSLSRRRRNCLVLPG